jgi:hypothetical protein
MIKAIRILNTVCKNDLTNLPNGLEVLYLDSVVICEDGIYKLPRDLVDLNLPSTLNYLYINEHGYNVPFKVPYGCKVIRISPRNYGPGIFQIQQNKDILTKMTSLYPNNQIKNFYSRDEFENYFALKKSF